MGSNANDQIPQNVAAAGSDSSIEIKIKTLDSQTYTLRVDKQMPVPALKERIASVTGVLSEQQRLICRGRVLKDDQLLSAYHVEDGHTLHLVVRQPVPPSSDSSASQPDSASHVGRSRGPSIVIETFSMPHHGDGIPPEISRLVSAVLGSIGLSGIGGNSEANEVGEHGVQRPEVTLNSSTQSQHEQSGRRDQSDRLNGFFELPRDASLGPSQPPVIPDSLTTLSHYLGEMRREFDAIGRGEGNDVLTEPDSAVHSTAERRNSDPNIHSGSQQHGLPSPASLAEVMLSTHRLLTEQVTGSLLQLARQLENQANVVCAEVRSRNQTTAFRTGVLFHNLGAFLLELGRSITTLRLGRAPSEAVVNAGPAVFISPSGPNPLMVQPFSFQPGTSIGGSQMGTVQTGGSIFNGVGTGIRPRRIDIQIRREGSSMPTTSSSRAETDGSQQQNSERNLETNSGSEVHVNQETSRLSDGPSFLGDSGIRVVPLRTMVAAVPGSFSRLPTESTGDGVGLYYPFLGRFPHVTSESVNGDREFQASGEHNSAAQNAQQLEGGSAVQQQNSEATGGNGPIPAPGLRQQDRSDTYRARGVGISILSAGGNQSAQESEGHFRNSLLQYLRNLFPNSEVNVESAGVETRSPDPVNAATGDATATANEAEGSVSEEGIFLSNLLQQIMPIISQHPRGEQSIGSSGEANVSGSRVAGDSADQNNNLNIGTSHRRSDSEPGPSSKRQKME